MAIIDRDFRKVIILIIAIIALMILLGIVMVQLTERGIFEKVKIQKNKYDVSEIKEKLEFEIEELRKKEGDTFKKEDLIRLNNDKTDVKSTKNFPVEIIYENYKFNVDEQFVVTYIGEANGTIITYTTYPKGYTNQDSITLTLVASNEKGIKTIEASDGLIIKCNGKKKCATDVSYIVNGTYTYKVIDMEGNEAIKEILIEQIDKLQPLDFIPKAIDIGSQFIKISVNAEDADATSESVKSGIDKYEYFIKEISEGSYRKYTSKESEYTFTKLSKNTQYSIYAIAYDKAGNSKGTEPIDVLTHNTVSLEKILLTTSGFVNAYDISPVTGQFERYVLDKSIKYTTLKEYLWQDSYQNLYNAFDGDINTYARFGAHSLDPYGNGTSGGYINVEENCVKKFLNIYNTEGIVIKFRNLDNEIIGMQTWVSTSINSNKIVSIQIPENTMFIEIYYGSNHLGGRRTNVFEIFLTDMEIKDTQNINEFFSN